MSQINQQTHLSQARTLPCKPREDSTATVVVPESSLTGWSDDFEDLDFLIEEARFFDTLSTHTKCLFKSRYSGTKGHISAGTIQGGEGDSTPGQYWTDDEEYAHYDDDFNDSVVEDAARCIRENTPTPLELQMQEAELSARLNALNKSLVSIPRTKLPRSVTKMINSDGWRIVEATYIFYRQLKNMGKKDSIKLSLAQYVIAVTGKSLTSLTARLWTHLYTEFRIIFSRLGLQGGEDEPGDNPFIYVSKFLKMTTLAMDHPILVKLRSIFHHILSLCLLERFGISYDTFLFSKAEKEASQRAHTSQFGFVMSVVEGSLTILERLYDVVRTGSWAPILQNGESYAKWADEVYLLKEQSQMLHNPQANGFTYHDFVARMESALEQGDAILKWSIDLPSAAKSLVKKLLSELRLIRSEHLTKKAARESRNTPWSCLIYGGSSVGKSSLIDILAYSFSNLHNLPIGPDYIYTRTFSDQYWSSLPASALICVLDDIANRNPDMKDDLSMTEILQIINKTPTVPPQADLADKGRIPLRPEFVIGTTNVKHLNASAYYCNTLAIARRFPLVITVFPKAEYSVLVNGTLPAREFRMLDDSRVPPQVEGEPPNLWDFKLEKVVAVKSGNGQGAKYEEIHGADTVDIFYLLRVMAELSTKHRKNQQMVSDANLMCKSITICKTCFNVSSKCECPQIQGGYNHLMLGFYASAAAAALYQLNKKKIRTLLVDTGANLVTDVLHEVVSRPFRKAHEFVEDSIHHVKFKLDDARQFCQSCRLGPVEAIKYEQQKVSQYLFDVGQHVRQCVLANHKAILGVIIGVPMILAGWKIYSHFFQEKTQGNTSGQFEGVRDEKDNPWYRDDYKVSQFDIGRLTSSWKGLTPEKVVELVGKNVMHAKHRYEMDGKKMATDMRIACVGGQVYMTNLHNMPVDRFDKFDLTILQNTVDSSLAGVIYYTIHAADMYVLREHDVVFFCMRSLPPRSSLLELFAEDRFKTNANGFLINRDDHGNVQTNVCKNIRAESDHIVSTTVECSDIWAMKVERNTLNGECGSLCLGFSPSGPFIGGIHVRGGVMNNAYSMRVTKSMVESAFKYYNATIIQGSAPNLTDEFGTEISLLPLDSKSPFRFISEGNASVYGSLGMFRTSGKSKVGDTFIRSAVEKRGCVVHTTAPEMRGWRPWRHAALDTVNQTFNVKEGVVRKCAQAYAKDILAGLSSEDLAELFVLNDRVTVNGQPGVQFIDKMKRNTSMGFPWRKKKSNYMSAPYQFEEWTDCVDMPEEFYMRTRSIEEKYRANFRYMPIFTNHLKDEPVKVQKAIDGKTRVFSGAPADFAFIMRKYLLTSVRCIQKNRFLFEAAPGLNTTSTQWDKMFKYLTKFGRGRMIAGDFSKFDKRMSAVWIMAAFDVLIEILTKAGWKEEDLQVIRGISVDVSFPLCDFNGDLVQFWGSNPSGHPLTVIINCLVNSLYMRYVWHEIGFDLAEFKKFVALMTYGDDNVMGVSPERSEFNHTSIQKVLATIGVVYTMADKETESIPFIDIDGITFLKRGWRYEEEVQSYVAPLEEESIFKMLTKNIPSSEVCPEQQGVDLLHGALREYWYYGREVFDQKRTMFLDVIAECGLEPYYLVEFTTYDVIRNEYLNNSTPVSVSC